MNNEEKTIEAISIPLKSPLAEELIGTINYFLKILMELIKLLV